MPSTPQPTVSFWGEYSLTSFFPQLSDSPVFAQGNIGAIQREVSRIQTREAGTLTELM
jgi:hypothetical protein